MDADENQDNVQNEGGEGEGEELNIKQENEPAEPMNDEVQEEPAVGEGVEEQAVVKTEEPKEPEEAEIPADSENPPDETEVEPSGATGADPEPETETDVAPETETAVEPETETAVEPETETGAEPETETAVEPETETAGEPETETTAESAAEPAVEPEAEAEPAAETTAEPETETGAEPDTEIGPEPGTETEAEPVTETGQEPETETAAEPETETATEPATETADNIGEAAPDAEENQNVDQEAEVVETEVGEKTPESPEKQGSGQEDAEATGVDVDAEEGKEATQEEMVTEMVTHGEDSAGQDETVAEEPPITSEMDSDPQEAFGIPEKPIKTSVVTESQKTSTQTPKKGPEVSKKPKKTYPYLARVLKESQVLNATRKAAPPHDYFGLIFSAESKRPPSYYHNYFLPVQKQPRRQQHLKIVGKTIPSEAINEFLQAPLHSMPLSTIKVRWMLNRRNTVYKASDLYAYLGKYGKVEQVYQMTNNSALVVFEDLMSALSAIKDPSLGYPWDALIAEWLEPRLNNRGYFKKYAKIEENPFNSELRHQDQDMLVFKQHCMTRSKK